MDKLHQIATSHMNEVHRIATTRMIGEPEDELATVVCACGWESPRTWFCQDSISTAFAEHLRTAVTTPQHGGRPRGALRDPGHVADEPAPGLRT